MTVDATKKLARAYMQHQFLPDVVFLATPDTPAKMLTQVEEMVEVIASFPPEGRRPHRQAEALAARPAAAGRGQGWQGRE